MSKHACQECDFWEHHYTLAHLEEVGVGHLEAAALLGEAELYGYAWHQLTGRRVRVYYSAGQYTVKTGLTGMPQRMSL